MNRPAIDSKVWIHGHGHWYVGTVLRHTPSKLVVSYVTGSGAEHEKHVGEGLWKTYVEGERHPGELAGKVNWNDPASRLALIEEVGIEEYNRRFAADRASRVVATVNGRRIITEQTRFGTLYAIEGTKVAYQEQSRAEAHAKSLPKEAA